MNSAGKRADKMVMETQQPREKEQETFQNMAGQESISRFDKKEPSRKRKKSSRKPGYRRGPQ